MKRILQIIILLTFISCQDIHDKLSEGSWIISEGSYNDQRIEFASKDLIQFVDRYGNINVTLTFFSNGKIIIPGIESSDIYGSWKIVNNQLNITIDSAKYDFIYDKNRDGYDLRKLLSKDSLEMAKIDSISEHDSTRSLDNPLDTKEFENAIKIYENPFDIKFAGDNLILKSATTTIVARKDRSLDDLFEGL